MASMGMQMAGCVLALVGWIGVLITCGAPMWRVSAFIGANIVTSQTVWEGIWMSCVVQSTGQMQCKVYDSMLALSSDLQGARALMVVSIITGIVGLLLAFAGGKCTNLIAEKRMKARVSVAAGVILIISGFLCLIAVSWTASSIIQDFYNPQLLSAQKMELGASLYIGWGAGALLLIGGGLLCASCPPKEDDTTSVKYFLNKSEGITKKEIESLSPSKTYI
uniref:Claudin-4-like n=1 Tax=Tetraodon nigroviridis TaxID=99883 RepID=H3BZW2_TETNG